MDIALNRRGSIPLRDQIVAQVEIRILAGDLRHGDRLPSVRDMAARLSVHPRTVHAAYRRLQQNENLVLQPGSGAYVRRGEKGRRRPPAEGLGQTIDALLNQALGTGLSLHQLRCAARRWLDAAPPRRAVAVDMVVQTAEILAAELRAQGLPCAALSLDDALARPDELEDALVACLPFHLARLESVVPKARLCCLGLEIGDAIQAILDLPQLGVALFVSHSPRVGPYARAIVHSLRGDDIEVACALADDRHQWPRQAGRAHLVLADVVALATVRQVRPDACALHLLGPRGHAAVRAGLTFAPPPALAG